MGRYLVTGTWYAMFCRYIWETLSPTEMEEEWIGEGGQRDTRGGTGGEEGGKTVARDVK